MRTPLPSPWRRLSGVAAVVLAATLVATCSGGDAADPSADAASANGDSSVAVGDSDGSEGGGSADPGDGDRTGLGPAAEPVRHPISDEIIYFVLPDRFANGDPSNDTAGLDGGPLDHGFLPTDKAYHHGGDLTGLTAELDYIEQLGATAIWITPPFTNRYVQGDGTVDGSSSSYHGYWQVDWDQVDPHLGTEEEMQAFIAAAHDRDMKVIFDVVVNHTADVIDYADGYGYRSLSAAPYTDANGTEIDLAALASGDIPAPDLDPELFPRVPVVEPELSDVKSPAWLNDVTLYHNRGNSTFSGENSLYGDFFGLDDLFTEHPAVVDGMIDLHVSLIERYDIDGFRVDTMKHVNPEFWARFAPAITDAAADLGKPDFFLVGEVAGEDPILQSSFTNLGVTSTLDFLVSGGLDRYVAGGGRGSVMTDVLDEDDWFTDADNNASMQVTFFGNHDMGRMGYLIDRANPGASDEVLLDRMKLGFDLLFLLRGAPVVYYGDEQGFVGTGGDQLARHDMFPTRTPEFIEEQSIGGGSPADDNINPDHPLFGHVAALADLRADHPVFVDGAQVVLTNVEPADGPVFAFSRVDRDERIEYVVITNSNASLSVSARVEALSADTVFQPLSGGEPVTSDGDGVLAIEVGPLETIVLRADTPVPPVEPDVSLVRPDDGTEISTPRYRIEAAVTEAYAEVTFAVSIDGGPPEVVGVDDAPPYRVYWNNASVPDGAEVEILTTVADPGRDPVATDRVVVTMGER